MKKYILRRTFKVFGVLFILFIIFYSINDINKTLKLTIDVEKGQFWVKELMEKNPYSGVVYDTIEVIDVTDNFALVKYYGDTMVLETDIVKYNRKKIDKK